MPGVVLNMEPQILSQVRTTPEAEAEPQPPSFLVSHQKVDLDVDFSTQSLSGICEITILPQVRDFRHIRLDARQCVIHDVVTINGKRAAIEYEDPMKNLDIPAYYNWGPQQYDQQKERIKSLISRKRGDGVLIIKLPAELRVEEVDPMSEGAAFFLNQRAVGASGVRSSSFALDSSGVPVSAASAFTPKTAGDSSARFQPLVVSFVFTTKNFREGLHWVGLDGIDERYPHVFTRHSTEGGIASCIFPCVDDPAMRCTWEISIRCSRTLGDALKRRPPAHSHRPSSHHINGKRGLTNGHVHEVEDEYVTPLSDEDKTLEMTVICSGECMSENIDPVDSTKKVVSFLCSTIVAPQHIGFSIGPFEQVDLSEFREVEDDEKLGQGQKVEISAYCLPGREDQVRHTCAPLPHALDWFLLNFGNYPFPDCKFVFVDDQLRDTEHTASLSICSSRLLYSEDIIDPEVGVTRTLVHAIASQWFGVSIVPNQRVDSWVVIGLAHYMTGLLMKGLCGHNEYAFRQKTLSDKLVELDFLRPPLHALGDSIHLGAFEMDFMTLKAPLVMFILDKRIIKASGTAGLIRVISKIIVTANTGTSTDSVVDTQGFRKIIEKVTKYRQTEPFWAQWVFGSGCPRFQITQKFNKKRLCVEMLISQKQKPEDIQNRPLQKDSFRREFKEELQKTWAGDVQPLFTGPMTIRIHEADGTPYEHVVEIREAVTKIDIPYNTKYKRLKRTRRQKERMNAGAGDMAGEGGDEALYYCLGDVLQTPDDMAEWGLQDWAESEEKAMEQESYEWIRVDADFEWICAKDFVMPAYMWVSQLQQDRDVIAQQESMMYLKDPPIETDGHPLISTFLIRTLMDPRYYHGIRTMAAAYLKKHANVTCNWVGLRQLEKAYQEFFCLPGTKMPRPNDFSDKRTYKVEMAIARGLSTIRNNEGNCPKDARHLLLDMLNFNENSGNEYSDDFKIANLLSCLTESLIPHKLDDNVLGMEDDNMDPEPEDFKKSVIECLDRYQRRDAWMNSYHNIFTVTVLDCKQKLMKANVIPVDPIEFAQNLHDGNSEPVRIKAFEALIELGFLKNKNIAALLLNSLSTDRSPYFRDKLFEVLCSGLADLAFGEAQAAIHAAAALPTAPIIKTEPGEAMQLDGGDLIVEEGANIAPRVDNNAIDLRTTDMAAALKALEQELKGDDDFLRPLWKAVNSPVIGMYEHADLLDVVSVSCEGKASLLLKLRKPHYWRVINLGKGILHFKETDKIREKPLKPRVSNVPVEIPQPKPTVVPKPFVVPKPSMVRIPSIGPKPPSLVLSTPGAPRPANTLRISFSGSHSAGGLHSAGGSKLSAGAPMQPPRPPKRPLGALGLDKASERPHKIVKLKVNSAKVQEIQSHPPRPRAIARTKSSNKSASPAPKHSTASKPSPAPRPSPGPRQPLPTHPSPSPSTVTVSPASSSTVTGSSAAHNGTPNTGAPPAKIRKPLPDSAPRPHPIGHVEPHPHAPTPTPPKDSAPPRKKLVLKLNLKPGGVSKNPFPPS